MRKREGMHQMDRNTEAGFGGTDTMAWQNGGLAAAGHKDMTDEGAGLLHPRMGLEYKAYGIEPQHENAMVPASIVEQQFEQHMRMFEEFKAVNDERLREIASQKSFDPLTDQKLMRIENRLDEMTRNLLRTQRPHLGPDLQQGPNEQKSAFDTYIRKGKTDGFDTLETKGLSVGSEADGGFLVHPEMDSELHTSLKAESPMRSLATVMTISSSVYKRPFSISGPGTGWVAETAERPATGTPQIAELSFPAMELYAMPVTTKQLLDDTIIDVEAWLVQELADAFSAQETEAFISGSGSASPRGILSYPQQVSSSPAFGSIGTTLTGIAGGFDEETGADSLIELVHALPARYRKNGSFLMNRMTLSTVRRLKAGDGSYLFQTSIADGFRMSLMGFPIAECDEMPAITAGSSSIAFGDFRRAYLIVDRQGVQILRDPYSAKPYILFYATKRVGGGISDFNALRLLKFAAN